MKFDERAINVALVLLSVSLVVVGLEATLYLSGYSGEGTELRPCDGIADRGTFHPSYGWTEHPNNQYLERKGEDNWELHSYNSQGFRDTYNSGERNVIVLGDSFTRGTLASDDETYPYLLDQWSPNTSFRNYGAMGFGTDQELLVYRDVRAQYDHDLVILQYYPGNDMEDNVKSNPQRPQFEVRNGSVVQTHQPELNGIRRVYNHPFVESSRGFLREHTLTYRFLGPRLRATATRIGLVYGGTNGDQAGAPSGEALQHRLTLTKGLVENLDEQTGPRTDLLILYVPERGEVNPENPHRFLPEDGQPYWDAQREMLQSIARDNPGVHFLDTTPHLRDEVASGNRVYGIRDGHLDDSGYRVVAGTTYEWLTSNGFVEKNPNVNSPGTREQGDATCPA